MSLRTATFVLLALGMLLFVTGLLHGGAIIWIGFASLAVAAVFALWIKWGPNGWGWELRERRRFKRARERS